MIVKFSNNILLEQNLIDFNNFAQWANSLPILDGLKINGYGIQEDNKTIAICYPFNDDQLAQIHNILDDLGIVAVFELEK